MQCTLMNQEIDCSFMTKKGCTFQGGHCATVVEACEGCDNIFSFQEEMYCKMSANPAAKWHVGECNYASHIADAAPTEQKKINPLKASKRAAAGR